MSRTDRYRRRSAAHTADKDVVKVPTIKIAAAIACTVSCHAVLAAPPVLLSKTKQSYVTPAASAELAQICPTGTGYPEAWTWAGRVQTSPASATTGQPKIEQYRNGQLIATYSSFSNQPTCTEAGDGTDYLNPGPAAASGCGPFTRVHTFRLWAAGDTFLVYPAVYSGPYNQPWIGPEYDSPADFIAGISHTPDNITVQGVVQNNVRPVILMTGSASDNTLGQAPVYFDQSNAFHMDSINVTAAPGTTAGKAGVYESGASNLVLSNMRVNFFTRAGVNGVFGAGNYTGTLTLDRVELDHNGGTNGPAHNAYINASVTDPNFTVIMQHSWSHDVYYGHLFKSRAQRTVMIGNYFQGGLPRAGREQAETYLLDVPNGGMLQARNNVFVKNASGVDSNGMAVTFGMEGFSDNRPQSIDIENNSFVTFSKTYDGSHLNYPLSFLYPNVRPDSAAWPANIPTRVIKNAFVGFCAPGDGSSLDYRGNFSLVESFAETTKTYAFATKVAADDGEMSTIYPDYVPELGTPIYTQQLQIANYRERFTVGAED